VSISIEEVTSPGCHVCLEFERFWRSIEHDWPGVSYRKIDVTSPEGQELAAKYMILAAPGIIINGEVFSTGGFHPEKFVAKLKELSAQSAQ
jgi:hypothetical protein